MWSQPGQFVRYTILFVHYNTQYIGCGVLNLDEIEIISDSIRAFLPLFYWSCNPSKIKKNGPLRTQYEVEPESD